MYVLNFKKQFAPAIESGSKKQTIRAIRKDKRQPEVGDILRLYTGMRTKVCRRIADVVCTEVLPIKIYDKGKSFAIADLSLIVFGQDLSRSEKKAIAKADGFASEKEFFDFFVKNHGFPFNGILIKWEFSGEGKINAL